MTVTEDQRWGLPVGVPSVETSPSARQAINEMLDAGRLDGMMDHIDREGLRLTGSGGFLPKLIKAVFERGLATEQAEHLGYERATRPGMAVELAQRHYAQDRGHRGRLDVPRDGSSDTPTSTSL